MSYRADKPYGRRRTDQQLSADERRYLQTIRRDVEDDPSGMIRRYLRLAAKAFEGFESSPADSVHAGRQRKKAA